jgi:hypothetical protein
LATSEHQRPPNKQSEPAQAGESEPAQAGESEPAQAGEAASPDPLHALSERLDRASLQARQLAAEAAEAVLRGAPTPPPSGWAAPGGGEDQRSAAGELDGLVAALASLRDLVPPELQRRLAEALRELLLAIRALLDWYIERLDREQAATSEAEDIPIL